MNPPALSFGGEFFQAVKRRYQEVVVLVPFYGAQSYQLRRHVEFLNQLGFDCAIVNLKFNFDLNLYSSRAGFGIKHIWADQIEKILNEISGQKIVYAFSNPSASAIEALARRNCFDINALICDSGPSSELWISLQQMYLEQNGPGLGILRWIQSWVTTYFWDPDYQDTISRDLARLPKNFSVLSVRGWQDRIISPQQIDKIFEPHSQISWSKLSLPKAGHLNGLKDYSDEYRAGVVAFLSHHASMLDR